MSEGKKLFLSSYFNVAWKLYVEQEANLVPSPSALGICFSLESNCQK